MIKALNTYQKENRLHKEIARWFVVYTKYKTEKYVLDKLTNKGVEAYVPLIKYTKRYSKKIKQYEVPLINCYVFVKITQEEYLKVLQTEYISSFLKIRGNMTDVKDEEIDILRKVVGHEDIIGEALDFEAGKSVEIIQGNLTGIRGRLVNKKGKNEFIVELESIGYQFRMSINKTHLRSLS
jgi:transcription antitermination factor NusG